jgi:hypothetical protein
VADLCTRSRVKFGSVATRVHAHIVTEYILRRLTQSKSQINYTGAHMLSTSAFGEEPRAKKHVFLRVTILRNGAKTSRRVVVHFRTLSGHAFANIDFPRCLKKSMDLRSPSHMGPEITFIRAAPEQYHISGSYSIIDTRRRPEIQTVPATPFGVCACHNHFGRRQGASQTLLRILNTDLDVKC